MTRRLRQQIGLDCQSRPTGHAAVRHRVSWSKARRAERAFLAEWDRARPRHRPCYLGADEIHRGKGQQFWTVLSDLVRGEVIGFGYCCHPQSHARAALDATGSIDSGRGIARPRNHFTRVQSGDRRASWSRSAPPSITTAEDDHAQTGCPRLRPRPFEPSTADSGRGAAAAHIIQRAKSGTR